MCCCAGICSGSISTLYHMIRHLFYIVLGLVACVLTMMVPIATWQRLGWLLLIGAFGLLVMVLLPGIGREVNGSMRWIGFSFFNVQPSEIAKVFVVIYLAGYLVRQQKEVRESWMGFFKPFIVLLPMACRCASCATTSSKRAPRFVRCRGWAKSR